MIGKGQTYLIQSLIFVLHRQIAQLFNFQQSNLSIYFKKTHLINTITITDTINACTDTFYVKTDTVLTYKIIKGCVGATPASFKTNACSQPSVTGPDTITYSNDTVTVTAVGTYTITASGKTATLYIGSCSNCTNAPPNAEWKEPNANTTNLFPNGIVPLNNLVLQNNRYDSLLIFNNQPDIYCSTANTQLTLTDSNTFICTRTKMRGCTYYWKGIKADGYGKTVIINNASTLQDMSEGVHMMNNAFLQARNSTYLNNNVSIQFKNIKQPAFRSAMTGNTYKQQIRCWEVYCRHNWHLRTQQQPTADWLIR